MNMKNINLCQTVSTDRILFRLGEKHVFCSFESVKQCPLSK